MDTRTVVVRLAFVLAGHTMLVIGFVGIFLPILPTTPFIIVACFCYERGSPRFHKMLLENRYVGRHLRKWKETGSVPLRAKVLAVSMIAVSIGGILYAAPLLWVKVAAGIIGVCVSAYILTRPSG